MVRDASEHDADACAAIYAPYVTDTAISFETEPPDAAAMASRIAPARRDYAWLVYEQDGRVVGYAYGGAFRPRAAYRWSCEVSVYLDPVFHGRGGGRALYEALFARLAARGYRMLVAGLAVPNDASVALHRAVGFEPIGTYRRIGWKHGAWRDVLWMQRPLGGDEPPG
jgi:phosphinothricin acetyltransferase